MKRKITIGLVCLLAAAFEQAALATADGPDFYCVRDVKKDDVLNLREKPSAKSTVLVKIPPDGCAIHRRPEQADSKGRIREFEIGDLPRPNQEWPTWCRVNFQGVDGWVACRFLGEDGSEKHPPFATDLWPGEGIPRFAASGKSVTLRVAPNRDAPVVATWKPKKKARITADSHLLVVARPAVMHYEKTRKLTAQCFGEGLNFLTRHDYYRLMKDSSLTMTPKTNAYYFLYRAEGVHLVSIDQQVCQVSEEDLGKRKDKNTHDWWIKIPYAKGKTGWVLVGDGITEDGRSF